MSLRRMVCLALPLVLSCASRPSVESPPASTASSALPAASAPPTARGASTAEAPLQARFVELPAELPDAPCHEVLVALVSGEATVLGERLGAGDVLVTFHPERARVEGRGLAVLVDSMEPPDSCGVKTRPAPTRAVVRGQAAPPLVWANGAMEAHLDVPSSLSPRVYLGRLAGTAPVAEHAHEGSWEILCAAEASGTFVLDGVERRLGPREIVLVPAGVKHAWRPDAGSRLVGVQFYTPPGPEQRFRALAAAAAAPAASSR